MRSACCKVWAFAAGETGPVRTGVHLLVASLISAMKKAAKIRPGVKELFTVARPLVLLSSGLSTDYRPLLLDRPARSKG